MTDGEQPWRRTLADWKTVLARRECETSGHELHPSYNSRRMDGVRIQGWACERPCKVKVDLSYPDAPVSPDGLYAEHEARILLDRRRCVREGHELRRETDWSGWQCHEISVAYQCVYCDVRVGLSYPVGQ